MEACFNINNKKVIANFYLTILTFFHTIASLNLTILNIFSKFSRREL